jgi:hypothetical protein
MLTALLLLQAAAAAPCTAPAPLPATLAGFSSKRPVLASPSSTPTLVLTQGARATLLPAGAVRLPVTPRRAAPAVSYSGLFAFTVTQPGRYRVALGAAAWLDVVRDGAALTSVAHAHGPDCSGIRKMVDFDLQPGRYLLQIAGNPTPRVDVLVTAAA